MEALGNVAERVVLFEQPLGRDDLDGMAALRKRLAVPIAADESVRTTADVLRVIETGAAAEEHP